MKFIQKRKNHNTPIICIGMFLYNEEKHVSEALESLLKQSYKNFRLIILNDCSTDNTKEIVLRYAAKDKRISYFENDRRQGYAENYRRCFHFAGKKVDYFAWAAGHDKYHPKWLAEMVLVLNKYPHAVMAYPFTVHISDKGTVSPVKSPEFDTFELDITDRINAIYQKGIGYGNMIYGLFRAKYLKEVDIFPSLLIPDMVLLVRLSLLGQFYQIKKKLWYRRYDNLFSIKRQKKNVFSHPPLYSHIPWPIVNTVYLLWKICLFPPKMRNWTRQQGFRLCMVFFIKYCPLMMYHYPRYGKYIIIPFNVFIKSYLNLKNISKRIF